MLRNWQSDGKMTVYRNPINGYRLFTKTDSAAILRQAEESDKYFTGWKRAAKSKWEAARSSITEPGNP
jgi:hypothetical protein